MADKQGSDSVVDTLKDLMAVQLLLANVPQKNVQKIVKYSINRVNAIAKEIKTRKEKRA